MKAQMKEQKVNLRLKCLRFKWNFCYKTDFWET